MNDVQLTNLTTDEFKKYLPDILAAYKDGLISDNSIISKFDESLNENYYEPMLATLNLNTEVYPKNV